MDDSKKWEMDHLSQFSTHNEDPPLFLNNLLDSVAEDLNIVRPTKPGHLVINVEEDEDVVMQRLIFLVIGASYKTSVFEGHQFLYISALDLLGPGSP